MDSEFPDFLLMNQNWNQQQRQQSIDQRHLLSDITSSSSTRTLSPLEQQNRLSFLEQHQHRQPFPIRNHLQQSQQQNSSANQQHQRIRLPGDTTISRSNLVGTSFVETSVDSTSPPPIIQSSSSVASSSSSSNGLGSSGSVLPEQEKKIANSIRGRGSFCVVFFSILFIIFLRYLVLLNLRVLVVWKQYLNAGLGNACLL